MIILISPAKSLSTEPSKSDLYSVPRLMTDTWKLAKVLKTMNAQDLRQMMSISDALAIENVKRFKHFKRGQTPDNSKTAIETFDGDVYRGLEAQDFTADDMAFAQNHLRILSGMYGILRPLDLIQEYRLEMGSALVTPTANNLYQFWDQKITKLLNKDLKESGSSQIVNLASNEYFKAVKKEKLKAPVLDIDFKEYRDGELRFVSFNAKKARGFMARYIIKNQLTEPESLKGFDTEGYSYSEELSSHNRWMFVR